MYLFRNISEKSSKKERVRTTYSPTTYNLTIRAISRSFGGDLRDVFRQLNQAATIYSFRHTGAIEIFKRTGSITKLLKAMGHSSINVSLTYLRGLEIPELNEEDMPMIRGSSYLI